MIKAAAGAHCNYYNYSYFSFGFFFLYLYFGFLNKKQSLHFFSSALRAIFYTLTVEHVVKGSYNAKLAIRTSKVDRNLFQGKIELSKPEMSDYSLSHVSLHFKVVDILFEMRNVQLCTSSERPLRKLALEFSLLSCRILSPIAIFLKYLKITVDYIHLELLFPLDCLDCRFSSDC